MKKGNYYTGTSGLLLPVPNKSHYPKGFQDKSRLCYYGSLFNSLEVNSSFYKIPMASTVARWASEVPDDFKFTFKLPKDITHSKELDFDPVIVDRFMHRIDSAGHKKGCLLIQFPASIRPTHRKKVEQLFQSIIAADAARTWKLSVEFRHSTWYTLETYELLNLYQVGLVLHDKLYRGFLMYDPPTPFVYLRFHGPDGDYRHSYGSDFLSEYSTYVQEWLVKGKDVYSYFNNTIGNAFENASQLREYAAG